MERGRALCVNMLECVWSRRGNKCPDSAATRSQSIFCHGGKQHLDRRSIQAVARLLPRRTGACRGVPNQGTGEWCWTNPRTAGMMHAKALQVGLSTMRVIDAIVFLVLIQRLMLAALRPEKDGGWARARGRATADRFVLIPGR